MRSSAGAPAGSPAWLRCGPVKVHVSADAAGAEGQARAKRHVCFVVADLAETERALRERGVAILPDERPVPGWPRVFVRDPAGNRVELARPVVG
jgi:catechol 2,3-dioxygenase-like lactoylglutathione lyase family enzyme